VFGVASAPSWKLALGCGFAALGWACFCSRVPLIKNKQARAIARHQRRARCRAARCSDAQRVALPGLRCGRLERAGWTGGDPAPVLEKIHTAVAKIYRQPDMRERLISLAAEPAISTTEEFTTLVKSEIVKWAKAVKDSGAKLD